jgi:hypothetical protein
VKLEIGKHLEEYKYPIDVVTVGLLHGAESFLRS